MSIELHPRRAWSKLIFRLRDNEAKGDAENEESSMSKVDKELIKEQLTKIKKRPQIKTPRPTSSSKKTAVPMKCVQCPLTFQSLRNLESHVEKEHPNQGCNSIDILGTSPNLSLIIFAVLRYTTNRF